MDAGLSIQEKVKCVSHPGITLEEVTQNYDKWAEGSQYDKVTTSAMDAGLSIQEKVKCVSRPGITLEEVAQNYDKWAQGSKYDEDLQAVQYRGPQVIATTLEKYLLDRKDGMILDVAAGTGLVAEKLRELGFINIDALDPSEGMLEAAREKNLYQRYMCTFFTDNVDVIKTSTYDVLVCCGAMLDGHLKCNSLPEMIRCVKTGGLILLVGNEGFLEANLEYKGRLEPYMKQLETEGKWILLEKTVVPEYHSAANGLLFVFRVTK